MEESWRWRGSDGAAAAAEDSGGTAAREEEANMAARLESARKPRASRWRRRMKETKAKKKDLNERLKEGRSAFHAMTGRGGAASGQSPVSSWRDQTRLVIGDRTRTESGQGPPENPLRVTERAGQV
jgi:hypothetical protein